MVKLNETLERRYAEEAKSAGIEYIGLDPKGFGSLRLYRFPCGHERLIQPQSIRRNNPRCYVCFESELLQKALSLGLEFVSVHEDGLPRRNYKRISCGHILSYEMFPKATTPEEVFCKECYEASLHKLASENDLTYVGPGNDASSRTFTFNSCGHTRSICIASLRKGNFICQTCKENKETRQLEIAGLLNMWKIKGNPNNRIVQYRECMHKSEATYRTIMNATAPMICSACLQETHKQEAEKINLVLLDVKTADPNYRLYRFPCRHEQLLQIQHVRRGSANCQICQEHYYTKESGIYLLEIKYKQELWLKLGFSKRIRDRILTYGLPKGAVVDIILYQDMPTGYDAVRSEKALHAKYKPFRLNPADMKKYHKSGGTECYPINLKETLLKELANTNVTQTQ